MSRHNRERTKNEQREKPPFDRRRTGRKREKTMYTKIQVNGITKEIAIDELEIFSVCPCCGEDVHVQGFFELVKDDPEFDPYTTEVYCDRCGSLSQAERHILTKCQSVKSEAEHIGDQLLCGEMTLYEALQHLRGLGKSLNPTA